jgi:xanthine dehydrogenase molybdenum-binding subunit
MSEAYRFVGRPTPRQDAADIVTGRARYIGDIKQPDMLYGKVLRSPHPHALIKNIDTGRAESLVGVKAVLNYRDVPDWMAGFPRHIRVLDRNVRFVGDAVALVAAVTPEIAEEALDLIDVEYERLPAVLNVEAALDPDAPQLYDQFPGNQIPVNVRIFGPTLLPELIIGDVEKGFEEADFISEAPSLMKAWPIPCRSNHRG